MNSHWQKQWNTSSKGRWLYALKPQITRNSIKLKNFKRRDQVIISRLRLGKACLNENISIMIKTQSPQCRTCHKSAENIPHILFPCEHYKTDQKEMMKQLQTFYGSEQIGIKEILNQPDKLLTYEARIGDMVKNKIRYVRT